MVKQVQSKGNLRFGGVVWSIGEAMKGEEVALRQTGEDRHEVYYCWKLLGVADVAKHRARGGKGYAPLEREVRPLFHEPRAAHGREVKSVNDVSEQV